jgi:hypothetical protein
MRRAGYVARVGGGEVHIGFWWGNPKKGDHLEDLGMDMRVVLKWISHTSLGMARTGLAQLRKGTSGELL